MTGQHEMASVGEMLRAAREKNDTSLQAVHQATKISVHVLKSLEQDDLDAFESEIYLKGFVRTYAEFLGMDVHQLLRVLDQQVGAEAASGGATWDTESGMAEEKLKSPRIFRRFVFPLLLVVIVVLVYLLIQERRDDDVDGRIRAPVSDVRPG